jgi:hypothetical protein
MKKDRNDNSDNSDMTTDENATIKLEPRDSKQKDEAALDEEKRTIANIKAMVSDEEPKKQNITLLSILGGDILTAQALRRQIWLIVLIVIFTIVYIGNRYGSQQELIEIDKLSRELTSMKYKALTTSSELTERSRESHVLEILQSNKDSTLHVADQPPFIISDPEQ